jgi:hypothetical protein
MVGLCTAEVSDRDLGRWRVYLQRALPAATGAATETAKEAIG